MRRLLRSKKGTVIGDLFGGITTSISHFLQSAPKPLLIIIFLAFLIFFAVIFSYFLNITGNFCDTAGNEYRTGTITFVTNVGLLTNMPSSEDLNSETLDADDFTKGTIIECSLFLPTDQWTYINKGRNKTELPLDTGYYFSDDGCVLCTESVYAIPDGFLGGRKSRINICLDQQVYPKPREDMNFAEKTFCGRTLGRCAVPEGYYYDSNTDRFVCYSDLCESENGSTTTVGALWNLKLKDKGAKLVPPSEHGDRDIRNALRIECDEADLHPKLRVFGVNPFDYRLWVFLIILSALIWLVFKIKRR